MNVCRNVITGARLFPDKSAIVFGERSFTYSDLDRLSSKAAGILLESGVQRGDRIGLLIGNVPAFVVWYFAALRVGAVGVAVNTRLTSEEMAFVLSDCGATLVAGTPDLLKTLGDASPDCVATTIEVDEWSSQFNGQVLEDRSIPPGATFVEMEPDEPATILYTSGTTGFPKGATLSHRNICATVHAFNHLCEMVSEDRLQLSVPLFHCYGQNAILNSGLNVGSTIYLQRRFDLNEAVRCIREAKITRLFGVPATFQMILDTCSPADLASVKYCFSAAATLPIQVSERWLEKYGIPIYEGYGLTETSPFASYNHTLKYVMGSIGMPVDLVEMKVVDTETDEDCPPDTPGEIAIRGPNVMLGYWNRPEETAKALQNGWFYSGDIGMVDEAGYFRIVDRLKDMVVVGGLKVYPSEVERVMMDHPGVVECAVVGIPDKVWGEKVVAFAVTRKEGGEGPTAEEIRAHCRAHLAEYKTPVEIAVVEELKRNPAGKILKTDLREQAGQIWSAGTSGFQEAMEVPGEEAGEIPPPSEPGPLIEELNRTHASSRNRFLTTMLQKEVQALLGTPEVPDADGLLMDLGMDSMMIVALSSRLQIQVGSALELPATLVFDHPTINSLVYYLLDALDPENGKKASAKSLEHSVKSLSAAQITEAGSSIEEMTDEEAMDALEKELSD